MDMLPNYDLPNSVQDTISPYSDDVFLSHQFDI